MIKQILNKYKQSKGLINYFALTYLDKIISFALPLSILFIIKDKSEYGFVEVAFSYATLTMIVAELGLSNYLFFGYKNAEDKDAFIKQALINFKFLLLIYLVVAVPVMFGVNYFDQQMLVLVALVAIRSLFTLFLNFYANIFRLKDNPSGIYLTSITVNVVSFALLFFVNLFAWPHRIMYFFIPPLALVVGVSIRFLLLELSLFDIKDFMRFLKLSLRYSWPIILNVLAMSFINNYAKIYAYGHMPEDAMVQVSYIMRIGLVIQLTHSAFASYFSKTLFMDKSQKINLKIFGRYSLVLAFSTVLVLIIILITNSLFGAQVSIPLSAPTLLFILYIILWCYIGYLEIYFGIMNANKSILYYSVFSSLVYILLLRLFESTGLFELSAIMCITAALNLALVLAGLNRLKVISFKSVATVNTEHE